MQGFRKTRLRLNLKIAVGLLCAVMLVARPASAQYPSTPQVAKDGTAVLLTNYATVPLSSFTFSTYPPPIDYSGQLSRVNFLRSEPANAPLAGSRFFVCDLNRNLYILTQSNRTFTTYINFEEVFPKFDNFPVFGAGLATFAFHPGYATNGIFYTAHTEDPAKSGSATPTNGALPGFNVTGYTTTAPVNPPVGSVVRQSVLVEWTDTNVANATFEGTARELLRIGFNDNFHPLGDMVFNPLAAPGDSDYGNLYLIAGDGAAGQTPGAGQTIPQRLDALLGKVLRITPDTNAHPADELSANGPYRIPTTGPDPNPFVSLSLSGLKKEIFAYGFRNPHRLNWDAVSGTLFVNDIGLASWEEVNIVHKGTNYGYAAREGVEQLFVCSSCGSTNGKTGSRIGVPFPTNSDALVVTGLVATVNPAYPVAAYSHLDGDAISSGFVYRGSLMPQLRGKYIFGDITTGRLFYTDLAEMIACDDGDRMSVAKIREVQVFFDSPYDSPNAGPVKRRMFDIVSEEYHHKGGTANALPGAAAVTGGSDPDGVAYGGGRADIRIALGGDDEIYVLSKSDGMIRQMVMAVSPPLIQSTTLSNGVVTITWPSLSNRSYRVQFKSSASVANWTNLPGEVTATGPSATKTDPTTNATRLYRVQSLP